MYKLYKVDAVHDIFKRIIKYKLTEDQMNDLVDDLEINGYEEQNILIECTNKVHEKGDTICITKDKFDSLSECPEKLSDPKQTIKYIYDENPIFPIKAKLQSLRLGNDHGQLIAVWENVPSSSNIKRTNVHFLEDLGFEFEQPTFEKIPIAEADDSILSENEQIIKYMMKDNNWTEEMVLEYLKPVYDAMNKTNTVFYQP